MSEPSQNKLTTIDLPEIFNSEDGQGNELVCMDGGKLFIRLAMEEKSRLIGTVKRRNGVVKYFKPVKEKNRHRKTNSWGICWMVLNRMPEDGEIVFYSPEAVYSIKVGRARERGSFLHFLKEGFEKQFFVPVKDWTIERLGGQ